LAKNGILLVDKPSGCTSHDVVARVRKLLGTRRVGHTGTLDPFATGLLVICVNRATRLVQFLQGEDKEYLATARFGFATDTGDLTGMPLAVPVEASSLTVEELRNVAAGLRGHIQQTPPMYSAKKMAGVKLYELARRGEQIERQPIGIEIKELEIGESLGLVATTAGIPAQDFTFRVVCSSGTYVRVLAEDLGKRLNIGAHLTALRRICVGQFSLTQAVSLERLAELTKNRPAEQILQPMSTALNIPEIRVGRTEQRELGYGRAVRLESDCADGTLAKLCNQTGDLLAIAHYNASMQAWQPRVVLCELPDQSN
jgi:tRNA pseudouridine55 synthase